MELFGVARCCIVSVQVKSLALISEGNGCFAYHVSDGIVMLRAMMLLLFGLCQLFNLVAPLLALAERLAAAAAAS